MTTTTHPVTTSTSETPARPGPGRRTALAAATFLTCAIPVVFTVNLTRMLLTGELAEHRFHQVTGQGLLLCAFWLGALLPLVRAGWGGQRPTPAAGLRHLSLVATGAVCSVVAPGGGAPILVGVIAVGGALLWWALPQRPRIRSAVQVDPLLLPVALVLAAALLPYAVDQLGLQNAATGHHARNPHYFDMAWLSAILVTQALLAAVLPAMRSLALPVAVATVALGTAGLAFGEDTGASVGAVVLGLVLGAARLAGARRAAAG
jgi:hypothetical protein